MSSEIDSLIDLIYSNIIIFILILLWLVGRLLKAIIGRTKRIPPDAKNGLRIIIGIFQLVIFLVGSTLALGIEISVLLSSSTLFATAIGFASTSVAANFVGGLYIIITRPFGIGDFIQITSNEGVVIEIGLNYTQIMRIDKTIVTIPNSKLLNATLLNSNVKLSVDTDDKPFDLKIGKAAKIEIDVPDILTDSMRDILVQQEVVRFTKLIQLKLNVLTPSIPLKEVVKRIEKTCKEFDPIFEFPIRFYFGEHVFRQNTYLVITAKDTETLIENYPYLMESLMRNVFIELQEVN